MSFLFQYFKKLNCQSSFQLVVSPWRDAVLKRVWIQNNSLGFTVSLHRISISWWNPGYCIRDIKANEGWQAWGRVVFLAMKHSYWKPWRTSRALSSILSSGLGNKYFKQFKIRPSPLSQDNIPGDNPPVQFCTVWQSYTHDKSLFSAFWERQQKMTI